jgi:hypothetical protein
MRPTKDIVKDMWRTRFSRELTERNAIRRLEELAPLIDRLPDELSHSYDLVFVTHLTDDAQVRRVCAEVRAILGVSRSEKSIDSYSGKVTLTTTGHGMTVKVYGGAVPDNCELIPHSESYIRWEMKCKETD